MFLNDTKERDSYGQAECNLSEDMIGTKDKCCIKRFAHFNRLIPLFVVLLLVLIPTIKVSAASSLSLKYDGKNVTYKSTQVKATYNGATINMKGTPGIVINNVALVSYKDVFVKSVIGASYKYDSAKKTVTLTKGSKTIKMTIGSKTAYVNGVKKTMDGAPKKVTYKSKNTTKILVPARFVAQSLGLGYSWNSTTKSSDITGPINLYYDGKNVTYSSTKGKVTVNGTSINVSDMPSIIINNTALIRAKKVLTSSGINAKYSYDSKKKVLTLTKGNTVIKLTMGSKTADVNGKKYTMDTAARVIKNRDTNKSYVMVPGSFVITKLGFNYTWNNSTKTSVITKKTSSSSGSSSNSGSSNNNSGSTTNTDKEYVSLGINSSLLEEFNYVNNITNADITNNSSSNVTNIESITKTTDVSKEQFTITASTPFNNISSSYEGTNVVAITLNNSFGVNNTYTFDNSIVSSATTTYNQANLTTTVKFNIVPKNAKYEVTLSEDKLSLVVTVYNNYISNITANYKSSQDIVTITGISTPEATITSDSNYVYVDMPYTVAAVGEQSNTISSGYCISNIAVTNTSTNSTRITIKKSADAEFTTSESGNSLSIVFTKAIVSNYDITIKRPSGVSFSTITDEDLYLNKKFVITVPGDYVSYYKSNPITKNNSSVKSISVALNSSGNTEITVTCSSILGYKLTDMGSYVGVTVGKPKDIYKNIVVLDAGHGGKDSGASYNGVHEKNIAQKILYTYGKSYFDADDNIKVYYTRVDDTFVELLDRANFASQVGADFFISLHMNAAAATSAKGTEVYYSTSNNTKASSGLNSQILATQLVNKLCSTLGNNNRGVKTAKYVVVHKNTVPAVLIELGFMTNTTDFNNMTNATYQKKAAKTIYDTVKSICNTYPTGR